MSVADWSLRARDTVVGMVASVGRSFSNRYDMLWWGAVLSGLAIAGLLTMDRSSARFYSCLLVSFIVTHATAPEFVDRFLMSMLPVVLVLVLQAVRRVRSVIKNDVARLLVSVAFILILFASPFWLSGYGIARDLHAVSAEVGDPSIVFASNPEFGELVREQNSRLSENDRVCYFHPNVLYYFIKPGVRLATFLLSIDSEKSYRELRNNNVTYLYVDTASGLSHYAQSVVEAHPAAFSLVASNKGGAIYKTRFE